MPMHKLKSYCFTATDSERMTNKERGKLFFTDVSHIFLPYEFLFPQLMENHAVNVSVTSDQRYSWTLVMEFILTSSVAAEPVMSPGRKAHGHSGGCFIHFRAFPTKGSIETRKE